MKRSEINKALKRMESFIYDLRISLPPFCGFTPSDWEDKGHEYDEIRDNMLGWDITDYGLGKFDEVGFSLITLRNGNRNMPEKYKKGYAEKYLFLEDGQYAPNHFHWAKMEDIINRGGGNLLIRVYNSLPNEEIDYESDVTVKACKNFMSRRKFPIPSLNMPNSAMNLMTLLICFLRCRTFRSFRPLTIITTRSNWQKKKPTMPAMLILPLESSWSYSFLLL